MYINSILVLVLLAPQEKGKLMSYRKTLLVFLRYHSSHEATTQEKKREYRQNVKNAAIFLLTEGAFLSCLEMVLALQNSTTGFGLRV